MYKSNNHMLITPHPAPNGAGLSHKERSGIIQLLNSSSPAFTLIEIMIVLVIISIIVTFASLSVGGFIKARRVEMAAKELSALLPLASQQAILQPAILGLKIEPHRYAFYRFVININTGKGQWRLLAKDLILRPQQLANNINLTLHLKEKAFLPTGVKNNPQIIFLPTGDNTSFVLLIVNNGKPPKFQLIGQGNGIFDLKEVH